MKQYKTYTIQYLGEEGKIKIIDNVTHRSILIQRHSHSSLSETAIAMLQERGIVITGTSVNKQYEILLITDDLTKTLT